MADADFPIGPLVDLGYRALSHGEPGRNGVAIVARLPIEEVARGLPEDPVPDDARLLVVRVGDLTIASIYAVNGKEVGDPAYELKLAWYEALCRWARATIDPEGSTVLAGISTSPRTIEMSTTPSSGGAGTSRASQSVTGSAHSSPSASPTSGGAPPATCEAVHVLGLPHGRVPPGVGAAPRPRARHRGGGGAIGIGRGRPRRAQADVGRGASERPCARDRRPARLRSPGGSPSGAPKAAEGNIPRVRAGSRSSRERIEPWATKRSRGGNGHPYHFGERVRTARPRRWPRVSVPADRSSSSSSDRVALVRLLDQ